MNIELKAADNYQVSMRVMTSDGSLCMQEITASSLDIALAIGHLCISESHFNALMEELWALDIAMRRGDNA